MEKKIKYPIEAFGLAMVMFSAGMKEAMLVGIALIFGDVLSALLAECFSGLNRAVSAAIAAVVTCGALVLEFYLTGTATDVWTYISFAAVSALLVKHALDNREVNGFVFNEILLFDSLAYFVFVILALVREYLSSSKIFGMKLAKAVVSAGGYKQPMFALIGAGIALAIIGVVIKAESAKNAAVWACIPAILLTATVSVGSLSELLNRIIGIVVIGCIYVTLRKKLIFSETAKHIAGVPVEMLLLGFVYLICFCIKF